MDGFYCWCRKKMLNCRLVVDVGSDFDSLNFAPFRLPYSPSFYRKIFFQLFGLKGYSSHDICKNTFTTILQWLLHSLSYSQSSRHSESLSKRFSVKGFFPQIRKRHEGYFTDDSLFVHPLRSDGRNQRDIRNNHRRPSCSPDASLNREAWVSGVRSRNKMFKVK